MERDDIIDETTDHVIRATLKRLSPLLECLLPEDAMLFRLLFILEAYPVIRAGVETAVIMDRRNALTTRTN
jgi:hypothetical protein